jgi:hypothetical protein
MIKNISSFKGTGSRILPLDDGDDNDVVLKQFFPDIFAREPPFVFDK